MSSKLDIEWLTKSQSMYEYYIGNNDIQLRGGRLYELDAIKVLQKTYNVKINPAFIKRERLLSYYFKMRKSLIKGDICVLDPYIVALGKFDASKKNIALIHHIDEQQYMQSTIGRLFLRSLFNNLRKVNKTIVVSAFWKEYLTKKGITNVEIIYNSYDTDKYDFTKTQQKCFIDKYELKKKPVIYLGQNCKEKGFESVLNEIDTTSYEVIVTGKNSSPDSRVRTLYFSDEEFPLFLSVCDLVILMSTMPEGWNRIAHEAILSRTPVIGSGSAGMFELLNKSGQLIMNDLTKLNASIKYCIENKGSLVKNGFNYVKQFDLSYFGEAWHSVISDIA